MAAVLQNALWTTLPVRFGMNMNSPVGIALSCAILGMVLVVTRDGWLSLFMAMAVVPDIKLLPLLCIVMLPAWLLLAGKPVMLVDKD